MSLIAGTKDMQQSIVTPVDPKTPEVISIVPWYQRFDRSYIVRILELVQDAIAISRYWTSKERWL
jgi:hypothetical protein